MSDAPPFFIAPTYALSDRRLNASDFRVLGALCSFYNRKTHDCWPSRASLQRRSGLGRTAVDDALDRLREYGYIEVWPRWNPSGAQSSNDYAICWNDPHTVENDTPLPDSTVPPLPPTTAAANRAGRQPPTARGGTKQRTELTKELRGEQIIKHPHSLRDMREIGKHRSPADDDIGPVLDGLTENFLTEEESTSA
jgi:hypothetical protein